MEKLGGGIKRRLGGGAIVEILGVGGTEGARVEKLGGGVGEGARV